MGGSYFGGSTIIGPGTGWFGKKKPAATPPSKRQRRDAVAKAAATAAYKRKLANQAALRSAGAVADSADVIAQRLSRRMRGVEVLVRKSGGELQVISPKKTSGPTMAGRPRLSVKADTDRD